MVISNGFFGKHRNVMDARAAIRAGLEKIILVDGALWEQIEEPVIEVGQHTTDIGFPDIVDLVLGINAGSYSFEAGNVRHEHEWTIWQDKQLPDGKVLVPGVVSHATNVVEHPELVAQRIERFAALVGRDNVIAGTDCGLGGRLHPDIAVAKLDSLGRGADIATKRLYSGAASAR